MGCFTTDTAKATGRPERSIQRDAERGEKVSREAMDLVRGTDLDTGAFLDKLKRQPTNQQVAYVETAKESEALRDSGKWWMAEGEMWVLDGCRSQSGQTC